MLSAASLPHLCWRGWETDAKSVVVIACVYCCIPSTSSFHALLESFGQLRVHEGYILVGGWAHHWIHLTSPCRQGLLSRANVCFQASLASSHSVYLYLQACIDTSMHAAQPSSGNPQFKLPQYDKTSVGLLMHCQQASIMMALYALAAYILIYCYIAVTLTVKYISYVTTRYLATLQFCKHTTWTENYSQIQVSTVCSPLLFHHQNACRWVP